MWYFSAKAIISAKISPKEYDRDDILHGFDEPNHKNGTMQLIPPKLAKNDPISR